MWATCPRFSVLWSATGFRPVQTGTARIAEAALDRRDPESWKNLAALAIDVAASKNCDEIMAWASLTEMRSGLAAAGFQKYGEQELMACGLPAGLLENELDVQLVHGDMAFFYSGSPWYLC
ncbi:MAG TPA: hypothetical protein VGR73_11435 [Bryobacteraceae bacterium]|nr:hypothetical protein [Bryobacteraceae bacterium]